MYLDNDAPPDFSISLSFWCSFSPNLIFTPSYDTPLHLWQSFIELAHSAIQRADALEEGGSKLYISGVAGNGGVFSAPDKCEFLLPHKGLPLDPRSTSIQADFNFSPIRTYKFTVPGGPHPHQWWRDSDSRTLFNSFHINHCVSSIIFFFDGNYTYPSLGSFGLWRLVWVRSIIPSIGRKVSAL